MSKRIPCATPQINRLRAAAALIQIIESGLSKSTISAEKAALMASFCEWSLEKPPLADQNPNIGAEKLAEAIGNGLKRIKVVLASPA